MTTKVFTGFKNIPQLKKHIKRNLPNCQVSRIKKLKTLQPSVKGGRTATQHKATFRGKC